MSITMQYDQREDSESNCSGYPPLAKSRILFVDAYDSFSQNIVALLSQELEVDVFTIHIDTNIEESYGRSVDWFLSQFTALVLGPGPGHPLKASDVGLFPHILSLAAQQKIPVLGICLGFQSLCVQYGLLIDRMSEPCHGHAKRIHVTNLQEHSTCRQHDIFNDIDKDKIWATCYNSLTIRMDHNFIASSRPGSSATSASFQSESSRGSTSSVAPKFSDADSPFNVLAHDFENNVMIIVHKDLPFWGFQFHPESCKSSLQCRQLVKNFFIAAKNHNSQDRPSYGFDDQASFENALTTLRSISPPPLSLRSSGFPPDASEAVRDDEHSLQHDYLCRSEIAGLLKQAANSSGNKVNWAKVPFDGTREQLSELLKPWSGNSGPAILESTKKGRFSIYTFEGRSGRQSLSDLQFDADNTFWVEFSDTRIEITLPSNGPSKHIVQAKGLRSDLLAAMKDLVIEKSADSGAKSVPFWGGFIGYMSYEYGTDTLGIDSGCETPRAVPEFSFKWVDRSVVFDNATNFIYVQSIRKHDTSFLATLTDLLENYQNLEPEQEVREQVLLQQASVKTKLGSAQITTPDRENYEANFDACQAALRAGDSYELCLTTEATVTTQFDQEDLQYSTYLLYKQLHKHNPVPFTAYLDTPTVTIASTSPEQFMAWSREGIIDMVPMKGTVGRVAGMTFEKATEILSSPKEQAENQMIADLIRHDLYSTIGHQNKVEVVKLCEVLEHETVYQLVSHIRAHPNSTSGSPSIAGGEKVIETGFKALEKSLPPGSMTGAPKKRSCQILRQLEARNRGCYSGVLGFLDVGGGGCFSVLIRTAFRSKQEDFVTQTHGTAEVPHQIWRIGAGGAITVLSDKRGEWDEMQIKLRSVLKGFGASGF